MNSKVPVGNVVWHPLGASSWDLQISKLKQRITQDKQPQPGSVVLLSSGLPSVTFAGNWSLYNLHAEPLPDLSPLPWTA